MDHVFISYVRDNTQAVRRLYNELTAYGIEVWLDRNDIMPGTRWRSAIRRAIQDGDFFIACFSKEYNKRDSTYMNEELTLAIEELRKRSHDRAWFIPVKLSECEIPDREIGAGETIQDLQWLELHSNWSESFQQILDVIQPLPKVVRYIAELLHPTKSQETRLSAVTALGAIASHPDKMKISDARVMPFLKKALNDRNIRVRIHAAFALSRLGDPEGFREVEKYRLMYGGDLSKLMRGL